MLKLKYFFLGQEKESCKVTINKSMLMLLDSMLGVSPQYCGTSDSGEPRVITDTLLAERAFITATVTLRSQSQIQNHRGRGASRCHQGFHCWGLVPSGELQPPQA